MTENGPAFREWFVCTNRCTAKVPALLLEAPRRLGHEEHADEHQHRCEKNAHRPLERAAGGGTVQAGRHSGDRGTSLGREQVGGESKGGGVCGGVPGATDTPNISLLHLLAHGCLRDDPSGLQL